MTTPLLPPFTVEPPTPEPSGYGLYSVAFIEESTDPRASGGIEFLPPYCGTAAGFPVNCGDGWELEFADGMPWVTARSFGVQAGTRCKLVGADFVELQNRARTVLRLTESHAVERGFWTGDVFAAGVVSPHLAAGDAADAVAPGAVTVLSGTAAAPVAVKPAVGLGLLEEAIGGFTGAVGVIHAPRLVAPLIGGLLSEKGGVLRTIVGTKVALGTGYPGTGPDGAARPADIAWLYATGPVKVVRGAVRDLPEREADALDRATNDATVQAARIVSVGSTCGLVAVPMTLT